MVAGGEIWLGKNDRRNPFRNTRKACEIARSLSAVFFSRRRRYAFSTNRQGMQRHGSIHIVGRVDPAAESLPTYGTDRSFWGITSTQFLGALTTIFIKE